MSYPVYQVPAGDVLPILFGTYAGSTGASVTTTGLAVTDIEIYKDGSVTQRASDAGYTLLDTDGIDFDGLTGIHGFSIDTGDNTDASFYTVGAWFHVVVSAITVDSQTVSFIAAAFRIVPAESSAGVPKTDVSHWLGTAAATPTTAGVPEVDVTFWLGGAVATPTVTGVPEVDVTHWIGTAAATPTVAGVPEVDVTHFGGSAGTFASGVPAVNATQISGDSAAADAVELAFDATAGPVPSFGIIDRGTAQSATGTTLVLRSAAAFADDEIIGATIVITGGSTGVGQARVITDYVSTTDTATVATWTTTPSGTITYEIYGTPSSSGSGASAADVWAYATRTLSAIDEDSTTLDLDATIRGAVGMASANLDTQLTAIDDLIDTEVGTIVTQTGAAAIRTAVGLASANLDTQLTAIDDLIDTEIGALTTAVADIPTNAELATALGTADDAVLAAIAALNNISVANILAATVEGSTTLVQALRLLNSALGGKASGLATTTAVYRDIGDTKDRITATVDADGNRSAVTLDLT